VSVVRIPLFDTPSVIADLRPELDERIRAVVDSGRFILGPELQSFEHEFASYLGVEHVVGVGNGTDALRLALLALGIGPGDDVVVPSFTFYASVEPIIHAGARPVFCDVDPETFCASRETIERALTPATKAVVAVHLFGMPAPLDEIIPLARERGIAVVADAAQAAGAQLGGRRIGTLADVAMFSFFPSKNLFCLGDGGAIVTSRREVAERARELRLHGSRDKRTYTSIGFNSRLDALQAAVLRVTLRHLDEWNDARRSLAGAYAESGLGAQLTLPEPTQGASPVHHLFVTRADDPDEVAARLERSAIESRSYYRTPVHRQPAMERYAGREELPGTEDAARTNLALPMAPNYGSDVAHAVAQALGVRARDAAAGERT
jgi:dTDP-3-amino-3,4,6-trideoxy-alpha-D-glucose transaminase